MCALKQLNQIKQKAFHASALSASRLKKVTNLSETVVYSRPCKFHALSTFGLLFIPSPVDRRPEHTTKRATL